METVGEILLGVLAVSIFAYALFIFAVAFKSRGKIGDTRHDVMIWITHGLPVLLTALFATAALVREDPYMITALAVTAVADYFVRKLAARPSDTVE